MEKRAGPLHERVVKRVLVNGAAADDAPTAANIQDALGLLRQTGRNDTVMLFVSGHGVNDGPNYRFVPTDAAFGAGGFLRPASVVPWYAFQEALVGAKGRRILFLDTCHSGNAFNQKLLGDSYEANIVVYSSARWDQLAREDGGAWRRAWAVHLRAGGGRERRRRATARARCGPRACTISSRAAWASWPRSSRPSKSRNISAPATRRITCSPGQSNTGSG